MATWPNAASPASSRSLTPSSASLTREAWKRHTYNKSRSRYLSVGAPRIAVLVPAHGDPEVGVNLLLRVAPEGAANIWVTSVPVSISEHLGLDAVPLKRTRACLPLYAVNGASAQPYTEGG